MASDSLFASLLGAAFVEMPAPMQRVHDGRDKVLVGKCTVSRGTGFWSQVFAGAASLPPAGADQEISVSIESLPDGERWVRTFGKKKMISRLRSKHGLLMENLGPMQFTFQLIYNAATQDIHWLLRGVKLLAIPLPISWFSAVAARESCVNGQYQFDVSASLPLAGLLVHYQGWLSTQ